ncbi:IclR family transcriptional regulator [Thioclava sp. GXIMD2076]|uniref:IclR family transcriptional regulator n=1 Tax=Thioclava sp. GXIMD2076 TaxID=3131931 RepID=UPI0030CDD0EF
MGPIAKSETQGGVQSVTRALDLMRALARAEEGRRVSDLAKETGLAVSTAHRLLTTLELSGFAQFDSATMLWHVGREAFAVGATFGRRRNFVAPALPFLRRLRDATRETANLGILEGDRLVTVSQVESREIMRAISPPGGTAPVFCSGMGKAIVSTWEEAQIRALIGRVGLPRITARSLATPEAVLADLAACRQRGYAVDNEEHITGLRCVASVVWSAQAEPVCAISISGLAARLPEQDLDQIGQLVRQAAHQLTQALGGTAPEAVV